MVVPSFVYNPPDTSQSNVIVGPSEWHTSPVWSHTFSDNLSYFMVAYEWTHQETRDSSGRLVTINFNNTNLFNEFAYGQSKTWNSSGWSVKTTTQQGQLVIMLASLIQLINHVQGPWTTAISPPPNLASGQTWSVEYEGLTADRTQAPDVADLLDLTIHMAVEGNADTPSGYTPAGGHARISLMPPSRLPVRTTPSPQNSGQEVTDSGSFTQKATYDFGAGSTGVETVAVHLNVATDCRIYRSYFGSQGWAELIFDVTSGGVPFVGPPSGWDFATQGVYTETWLAPMSMFWYDGQDGYSATSVDLTWQPPRWRYVYDPPPYPDTGNAVGTVDRQDTRFRPRVPTGGNSLSDAGSGSIGWTYDPNNGWVFVAAAASRSGVVFE